MKNRKKMKRQDTEKRVVVPFLLWKKIIAVISSYSYWENQMAPLQEEIVISLKLGETRMFGKDKP